MQSWNHRSVFIYGLLFVSLLFISLHATPLQAQDGEAEGLVTTQSGKSVEETVKTLVTAIEERGLRVMRVIDHSANAASVDKELRPTQVILFGNPNLGTQLMNNSRTVGIDLPQKYLVWEDADGSVHVSYNGVPYLVGRHGLTGPEGVLNTITGALANFVNLVMVPMEGPGTLPDTGASVAGLMPLFAVLLVIMGLAIVSMVPRLRSGRGLGLWAVVALFVLSSVTGTTYLSVQADRHKGLILAESTSDVETTVAALQAAIADNGLNVMMVIDHAANAASVERELLPTQLILFGNPNVGTGLMQSNQTIGIDLPQKMLVWEQADGRVLIAYNDPVYLGNRHNITDKDPVFARVAEVLAGIVAASQE